MRGFWGLTGGLYRTAKRIRPLVPLQPLPPVPPARQHHCRPFVPPKPHGEVHTGHKRPPGWCSTPVRPLAARAGGWTVDSGKEALPPFPPPISSSAPRPPLVLSPHKANSSQLCSAHRSLAYTHTHTKYSASALLALQTSSTSSGKQREKRGALSERPLSLQPVALSARAPRASTQAPRAPSPIGSARATSGHSARHARSNGQEAAAGARARARENR